MTSEFFGEFMGTLILILLGNGVVAGVLVMTSDVVRLEADLLDPLTERHFNAAIVTPEGRVVMQSKGAPPLETTLATLREAIREPAAWWQCGAGGSEQERSLGALRGTHEP